MLKASRQETTTFQRYCEFCDEFAGGIANSFYARYRGSPETRTLLSSENFQVFPSIGQLVEGYLLLAPKKHFAAFDEVPPVFWDQLEQILDRIRSELSNTYGRCVTYEHGARRPENGGCGIYHAHLHTTPLAGASDPVDVLKRRFPYTELAGPSEITELAAGLSSYLFYQDSTGRLFLFDTGPLPSQYMRKLLAESLGTQDWDWRSAGREEKLLATLDRLSGKFEAETESTP